MAAKKKAAAVKEPKTTEKVKVEDLQDGDVIMIDGSKRKMGHRYKTHTEDEFSLWLLDGKVRWHRVKAGTKIERVIA